jgi:integrase/recombinase XerC
MHLMKVAGDDRTPASTSPVEVETNLATRRLLSSGVTLVHPEETVFQAMVANWAMHERARNLKPATIEHDIGSVEMLKRFTNDYPWNWRPGDLEEWSTHLLSTRRNGPSTVRGRQTAVGRFQRYLLDSTYDWINVCQAYFDRVPMQILTEFNHVVHRLEDESGPKNRAFTQDELQRFFDYCDERVKQAQASGRKGTLATLRDGALFKTQYAFGLRRREVVMLDIADVHANPRQPRFGAVGLLDVRWGKGTSGSGPRRRDVLTVWPWSALVLTEYLEVVRPCYASGPALWPTERGNRLGLDELNARFAEYRRDAGLPDELGSHCLRHSYASHLLEDGFDLRFVQEQLGHSYASTTSIYARVPSDYKNRVLSRALFDGAPPAIASGHTR